MADPFALMNRSLERSMRSRPGSSRQQPARSLDNVKDLEYLRSMFPDFDDVMESGQLDYRTRCRKDANFAGSFRIPPVVEPARAFREHGNSVDAVCWGPEPGHFLSASHDSTLKLWNAENGRCVKTLQGHLAGVYHCTVSPDRKLVASCGSGAQQNALIWQWPQAKVCLSLQGHRRSVVHMAFAPDSCSVASADVQGGVAVSDLGSGACALRRTLHLGAAHAVGFCSCDPQLLCSAGADGAMQLLDLRIHGPQPAWLLPSMAANCVAVNTALSIPAAHDGYAVHALEFSDRETIFSCGADHKLKRWDIRMTPHWNPTCIREYLGHTAPLRCLAVAPNKRFIITGCEDGSCRVWPSDPLGDARCSLGEPRARARALDEELGSAEVPSEARALRGRRSELPTAAERPVREGHSTAVRALGGHVGLVSGCAWQDSSNNAAAVLSSSWDQSIQLFKLDLSALT